MSGVAAEGLSATATEAPANALHGFGASPALADRAPTEIGASVRAAATDHAASSAPVVGIGPVTPLAAPETTAIAGEWSSPAGTFGCDLVDTVPHLASAVAVPAAGETLDADGGGQAQLAAHWTSAISATAPSLSAFAEDQMHWWDSGHNLAEALTLQLAADLANLSAKDAHGFTVL